MYLGYIIGEAEEINTLLLKQVDTVKQDLPVLIIGFEKALSFFQELNTFEIKPGVFWCYSFEESPEDFTNKLKLFHGICFENYFKSIKVVLHTQLPKTIESNRVYLHSNQLFTTINTSTCILCFNKEISEFQDVSFTSKLNKLLVDETWAWNKHKRFDALLKSNLISFSYSQLIDYFQENNHELYFGYWCLKTIEELDKTSHNLWQRAFYTEEWLSKSNIYINTKTELDNEIINAILENTHKGVLKQNYLGTDKVTGRIFVHNSPTNVQGLTKENKKILIAKQGKLLEFDYDYFEFSLLFQILGLELKSDPHTQISKLLFNTEEKRDAGKQINYSVLYGKNVNKVLEEFDIQDKREILQVFLLDKIEELKQELKQEFETLGFITNYYGRKIVPNKTHALLNNYIQSTAADFVIFKLFSLFLLFKTKKSEICFQNHDSIIMNINENEYELIPEIKQLLEKPYKQLKANTSYEII